MPSHDFEARARELVSQMTLDEKISQISNSAPAIPRLGVPAYDWWNECLHGVGRAGIATVFPQAIGMAATWNVPLIHQVATAISDEARRVQVTRRFLSDVPLPKRRGVGLPTGAVPGTRPDRRQ